MEARNHENREENAADRRGIFELYSPLYKKTVRRLRSQAADPQGIHHVRCINKMYFAPSSGGSCARTFSQQVVDLKKQSG